MFASAFIGGCKQCKKGGRLKNESAWCAWSAARFCQNLWIEGLVDRKAVHSRGLATTIHHKTRQGTITRWHASRCQGLQRFRLDHRQWLLPYHKKYSTDAGSKTPAKKRSANMVTDRESVLSAALEQSMAATAQSLISMMFQALKGRNVKLAWGCYNDLTVRGMLHYLTRDNFRDLVRLFRSHAPHSQSLEYVLPIVDDMYGLGYRIGRKEKLAIMRLLGMNGKLAEMEQVFNDLKDEGMLLVDGDTQKPFNIMLDQYFSQRDTVGTMAAVEKSLDIFKQMVDLEVRPGPAATRLLMETVRCAGTSQEFTNAVWTRFWSEIGKRKTVDLEPSLYREMVLYFASAGRAKYALGVNDLMVKNDIKRDVQVVTALIHKVGRSGDIKRAMEIFDEMIAVDGIKPTLVTFNALIDIHAHKWPEADIEGASQMFELLQEYGLKPDLNTMGPLIDMFAKKGDVSMVRRLYHELIGMELTPNQHIYSSLIECFVKHDDKQSVIEILKLMRASKDKDKRANQVTYNLVIRSFARDHNLKAALSLVNLMVQARVHPNTQTFTPLLGLLADRGNIDGTTKVVEMMGKISVRMNVHTYTALLKSYTQAGDIRGAERIFQKIKKKCLPNTQSFNVLMYGYIKKNEMDMVLDTYRQMLKVYVDMNEYTYGILMLYFSRRKEPKAVESILGSMAENNVVPNVTCWTILMQSYFTAERFEDGLQVYERMKQARIKPNFVTHSLAIASCARTGDLSLAQSILANTIERYEQLKNERANRLADVHITSRNAYTEDLPLMVDELLRKRESHQLPQAKLPPQLFDPIINAYIGRSEFAEAKQLFKRLIDLEMVVSNTLYVSMMKLYKREERLDVVERMWNCLYAREKPAVPMNDMDPELGSDIPLPVPVKDFTVMLFESDEAIHVTSEKTLEAPSPFALSIYIDTLVQEQRFDDIEKEWSKLTAEGYPFDEHNWNRYLVSLAESGQIEQLSLMTNKFLSDEQNAKRPSRARDDPSDEDQHLYSRTCHALAEALGIIPDGLTDRQLYDTILGALKSKP